MKSGTVASPLARSRGWTATAFERSEALYPAASPRATSPFGAGWGCSRPTFRRLLYQPSRPRTILTLPPMFTL